MQIDTVACLGLAKGAVTIDECGLNPYTEKLWLQICQKSHPNPTGIGLVLTRVICLGPGVLLGMFHNMYM